MIVTTIRTRYSVHLFEYYVFLAIGTAVAQPFSFGWPNKYQQEKRVTKWYHNVWSYDMIFFSASLRPGTNDAKEII